MTKIKQNIEKIEDELNPEFIFSLTNTILLIDIVSGKIDIIHLAKKGLEVRGVDKNGNWIGFDQASKFWLK